MGFLGFIVKTIGSIIVFIITVKLVALILLVLGFALKLIWLAVWVGLFVLVAWVLYKIFVPRSSTV
jgi:hypothetical protein